jgi:signal transduction histidine kinase
MGYLNNILIIAGLIGTITLSALLFLKMQRIKALQGAVNGLRKSLEEMDEQAKMIVRTDIELNKAQDELDKKITGLYTLQRLSRAISTTLEENQVFNMIDALDLKELGFEKACAFLWDGQEHSFILQLNIGYTENDIEKIKSFIEANKDVFTGLIEKKKTVSSATEALNQDNKNKLNAHFFSKSFILSAILPKEGRRGFFFVGTEDAQIPLTEGDEELITILSNQIGQALENARLFEGAWRAQQELTNKVQERTRELSQALEEVKRASKRKTDFISSVSHELRTPLTSIKGYAAILLEEKLGSLPEAVKERLKRVDLHTNELVNMVNNLLDIARIESGKAQMALEKQNLKEIIATAIDLIFLQYKNKNVSLSQDIPAETEFIQADRSQIERVFINLLANAIKFTPQGGKVDIKCVRKNGFVQVDITDTGIGIPPNSLTAIFDEFYRVDNIINQQVKGTGLGLSLVKNIIDAHGGRIWVESKVGQGSAFKFTLPL